MKKYISLFAGLAFAGLVSAQSNVSKPMSFHIEKEVIPPRLTIVGTPRFIDQDQNGVIDANEKCFIRLELKNDGPGDAYGCVARVTATGTMQGVFIKDLSIPAIVKNTSRVIDIPINASAGTKTGEINVTIVVDEPNGYGPDPIRMDIGTHKLRTPYVQIASYRVSSDKGEGKLNRREEFTLQLIVQNTDQGTADNVTINLKLPANVNWTSGDLPHQNIGTLKPNETRTFEYKMMANQLAANQINIEVDLAETTGRYAKDESIPLTFGQYVGNTISMKVDRNDHDVAIDEVSLYSDVDQNIPVTNAKNNNTYVLIIANENYSQVASVPYALNDGNKFEEYCIKTLGINEKHIRYYRDATKNQIVNGGIEWLVDAAEISSNPQLILYYAGHGIPDEASKSSYILPVDGYGTDVKTGIKLDQLYSRLGSIPASRIIVFMDACFSGSKREEGMLASGARSVAVKAKSGITKGNMVVLSAAKEDQTAWPYHEQKHGMFTYFLLKKLQETKGETNLQALSSYIISNVQTTCFDLNDGKKQTPCVNHSTSVGDDWQTWTLK